MDSVQVVAAHYSRTLEEVLLPVARWLLEKAAEHAIACHEIRLVELNGYGHSIDIVHVAHASAEIDWRPLVFIGGAHCLFLASRWVASQCGHLDVWHLFQSGVIEDADVGWRWCLSLLATTPATRP